MVGYTTEIRKDLFVIDINHLSINIEKVKTDSEISFLMPLFSVTLFVRSHIQLNKLIDLVFQ